MRAITAPAVTMLLALSSAAAAADGDDPSALRGAGASTSRVRKTPAFPKTAALAAIAAQTSGAVANATCALDLNNEMICWTPQEDYSRFLISDLGVETDRGNFCSYWAQVGDHSGWQKYDPDIFQSIQKPLERAKKDERSREAWLLTEKLDDLHAFPYTRARQFIVRMKGGVTTPSLPSCDDDRLLHWRKRARTIQDAWGVKLLSKMPCDLPTEAEKSAAAAQQREEAAGLKRTSRKYLANYAVTELMPEMMLVFLPRQLQKTLLEKINNLEDINLQSFELVKDWGFGSALPRSDDSRQAVYYSLTARYRQGAYAVTWASSTVMIGHDQEQVETHYVNTETCVRNAGKSVAKCTPVCGPGECPENHDRTETLWIPSFEDSFDKYELLALRNYLRTNANEELLKVAEANLQCPQRSAPEQVKSGASELG